MSIFGFIGTGNMGGAMATAARKAMPGENLLLSNRTPEKAKALAERLGARAVDNLTAAQEARLTREAAFERWEPVGEGRYAERFVTSWATTEAQVDALIALL